MDLGKFEISKILGTYTSFGYNLNDAIYMINVFGIRSKAPASNKFDDALGVLYRDGGNTWCVEFYTATTDPGLYWLENPSNVDGTAILVAGQHVDSHRIGLHKGQYRALVQNKPLPVYRDSNKDDTYDMDPNTVEEGIFGINIHRASPTHESTIVDKWSAGCQVLANPTEFDRLMELVDQHAQAHGNVFTYTLFNEEDVV
jgi:hypothetical protein